MNISYFQKAARIYYFISVTCCTISLLINQADYFRKSLWEIVITDLLCIILIYSFLFMYLKKWINIKVASGVYVYATLVDLAISNWLYYHYQFNFSWNFLFSTFLYAINITVAGFCVGRKHTFIAAGIYVISFGSLIFVSHDYYLNQNSITILFLILAFSFAVTGFLHILEKTHNEELELKGKIIEKDRILAIEQTRILNYELEAKKKENITKTMYLLEYAEKNNDFIKKLNTLKPGLKNAELQKLNDILFEYQTNNHEKYWKEFELLFLEIQPDFYKKLSQINPELSPSEQKLAALLYLGLSSKKIGALTSITPESVDVSRSRLRTKLHLTSDTNLITFLTRL